MEFAALRGRGYQRRVTGSLIGVLVAATSLGHAVAGEFVVNSPGWNFLHANAMDQPRLYGLLTDGSEVVVDAEGPVLFRAFIDTGSSGTVFSNLHATDNDWGVRSFGFGEEDYVGVYTNLGIGGHETGSVSRSFGLSLYNDPFPAEGEVLASDFVAYGEHRLWVRQQPGQGEVTVLDLGFGIQYPLVSPVNIVGMPVIEQRVMVMEWTPPPAELAGLLPPEAREMQTKLLEPGDPAIPPTNVTLDLARRDFVGEAAEGEVLPSVSRNPVVRNVRISHDPAAGSVTGDWLFDTGAGSSFISFAWAQTTGLIPGDYANLSAYMVDHEAAGLPTSIIGGVGPGTVRVPILPLAEIRIPTREGIDLIWKNARIQVFEHPELAELDLQGIFGMNLIGPAATVDAGLLEAFQDLEDQALLLVLLLGLLSDISPSPFDAIVFETTGEATAELRFYLEGFPGHETYESWAQTHFTPSELNDATISGPAADPDGLGIPNLLRYAFGMEGGFHGREGLPRGVVSRGDSGKALFHLEFVRRRYDTSVLWTIEGSSDLKTWNPVEANLQVKEIFERTERVAAKLPLPSEESRGYFYRVRIELLESGS